MKNVLTTFLIILFSFASCHVFRHFIDDSLLLSTCVPALIASLVFYKSVNSQQIFYTGCFMAMSASKFSNSYGFSFLAIVLSTLLFCISKEYFKGYGGKLGTIAFFGCFLGYIWIS